MKSKRIRKTSNILHQNNASIARIIFLLFAYSLKRCHGHSSTVSMTKKAPSSGRTHLQSLPKISPLLGESAIIDKETGRVYWQGGEQSLFHATVGHTYLKNKAGLARHVRSTLYSCILWMSVIRFLASKVVADIDLYLNRLNFVVSTERIQRYAKYATKFLRFFLVCLTCLPKFHRTFLVLITVFYFIESYTCSTRKYLSNVLLPENVESYLDLLKEQKPMVKWDLRCFHYEKRKLLSMILLIDLWKIIGSFMKNEKVDDNRKTPHDFSPSILSKKIVSNQTIQYYKFNSWEDETISGISKQNEAGTTINSDFTKISMCKLVLFANSKSRADYFIQQSNFINEEGGKDTYAELSTKVEVQGFKKRLFVVKRSKGFFRNFFSLPYFWLCTFLLLTVPFRVHFARHCDELHITLAKETSIDVKTTADQANKSWFLSTKSWFSHIGFPVAKPSETEATLTIDNIDDVSLETHQELEQTESLVQDTEKAQSEYLQSSEETEKLKIVVDDPTNITVSTSDQINKM